MNSISVLLDLRNKPAWHTFDELSANSSSIVHFNEYLYNGNMMQDELGLDWLGK